MDRWADVEVMGREAASEHFKINPLPVATQVLEEL
jgi:hypothetical protein